MGDYHIYIKFYPAGSSSFKRIMKGYRHLRIDGKKNKNVLIQTDKASKSTRYIVAGPSAMKTVFAQKTSTIGTFQLMVDVISKNVADILDSTADNTVKIIAFGHCIVGARIDGSFTVPLSKILTDKGYMNRVTLEFIATDPSEPFSNGKQEMRIKDRKKSDSENINSNGDVIPGQKPKKVIFYTLGGHFFSFKGKMSWVNGLKTLDPEVVLGVYAIYLVPLNHNDGLSKLVCDRFFWGSHLIEEQGVFLIEDIKNITMKNKVTTDNLKETIKKIYDFSKGKEQFRIKVLTNIIAVKLGLTVDGLVQYLPNYQDELDKTCENIKKCRFLWSAFNCVFNLSKRNGILWGLIDLRKGEFGKALRLAQKAVVPIGHNDHNTALDVLNREKEQTKYTYKKEICEALIAKIKRHYNISRHICYP